MHITSPVVHVNYEQRASWLFLMCLGRAAQNEAVVVAGRRGISRNWLPESFAKMLAEHVLCPLASISLMVHLYLWCAELGTHSGCLRVVFFLWYIYICIYVLALTWTLHPSSVIMGSTCMCLANSRSQEKVLCRSRWKGENCKGHNSRLLGGKEEY